MLAMACWVAISARPAAAFWREKLRAAICSTREVERKETVMVARSAVIRRVRIRAEPEEDAWKDGLNPNPSISKRVPLQESRFSG